MSTVSKSHNEHNHDHEHGLYEEFICHFPYGVFSIALGIILLTFTSMLIDETVVDFAYQNLFHMFHYLHIVFAAAGTLLTFFKFSKNIVKGLIIGIISPTIFCILSDIIVPYLGGWVVGVPMQLHICFYHELANIGTFLGIGLATGLVLSLHQRHTDSSASFARWSHFLHILLSSLASMFYMVANGFVDWMPQVGLVFVILMVAVVLPCTFSDVVVPILFARSGNKK
ncbi:hypothetical protein A3F06_03480 [candidate division TM6 bacterium RIFCSPHIGHO2_12_FULL_36_22]|nr:MAG: hypothetical protein A3F06_03480 [candidate division TM6 bacterium RIFCSPHIGHO2_12_FULL_36_22]